MALNGRKAYIACRGLVYDVTDSFLWKGGRHQACYSAGSDLTGPLEYAPHGIEFLQKFPVVGRIDQTARWFL
ncbi:MAG: cytochrome b5 domain-containing protein [Actinomycetota bacterium]